MTQTPRAVDAAVPPAFEVTGPPVVADAVGRRRAFAPLAVGPLVVTTAMLRLRRLPEAERLAGGRR